MLDDVRDRAALADAVLALCSATGLTFRRISMTPGRRSSQGRDVVQQKLRGAVEDPATEWVRLWQSTEERITDALQVYLRSSKRLDDFETIFQSRWVSVASDKLPVEVGEPIRAFIEAVARLYPVAHGAIGGYRALRYALREFTNGASVMKTELDDATAERLSFDQRHRTQYRDKLLRLYPVTIIGPAIWSRLPPLPPLAQPPRITDLGDCKMLTCWPTLCEPRDPAFLRGTRALREWLWPYTIQNPADHVDRDPP